MAKKLNAAHTAMERKMLDVRWQDHITNETIKQKTKIPDLMEMGRPQLGKGPNDVASLKQKKAW